mmetsp:Transcript_25561/g.53796  ORF Transcript_25561/g.53796 Transcript_25561/m.53796 type:complete len:572 (+) Transcript_25561:133-1848(+)
MSTITSCAGHLQTKSKWARSKLVLPLTIISSLIASTSSLSIQRRIVHRSINTIQSPNHLSSQISPFSHTNYQTNHSSWSRWPTQLRDATSSSNTNENANSAPTRIQSFKLFLQKIASGDLSVPAVLLAAFLNLLGFTMASPIQPALGKHFSLPIGASFGSLSSAYPLGMMLGVFLWPTLSDIIGRKIVMALTLFGSGLGLLLQAWGIQRFWTLEQFLAARVLTGCFAGNGPVSKAYLADRGKNGDLTTFLAWRDAASTLAFIVGPVLGGLLYQGAKQSVGAVRAVSDVTDNTNRISSVIQFSAIASLLASAAIAGFVKPHNADDDLQSQQSTGYRENDPSDVSDGVKSIKKESYQIVSCPLGTKLWTGVATVAVVSALYHSADSTFFAFFPSLLQHQLKFDTKSVGLAFTSFAFVSFTMSAFVSSRFIKVFGPVAACATGLGAIGSALITLGYAASLSVGVGVGSASVLILGAAGLYYSGVPLYGPTVPTMLLQCVPPHKRGAVMGFDGTINTLARVISPLAMGEIHRRRGASTCFQVAGSCVYGAVVLALSRRWLVLRKQFVRSQETSDT